SYVHVHGRGNDVQRAAFEGDHFAVDHDIDGLLEIELDVANGAPGSERMLDMAPVIELGQGAQEADAADRTPADKLDQTVGCVGLRGDFHSSAGKLAVVKGQKKRAALVPVSIFIAAQSKHATAELSDPDQHAEQIADMAERLEQAIGDGGHVGGETDAQEI